ncbi:ABC transporter permease subunit [Yinghuangia soli]|uniref:ABC transporter permease n=1 Tax=Yinghuangia soli TaxID=2908204 RepID=A0AA41Q1T7_9ACTN|nr:ABC transporter permease [Yinghuangia soli]MCF2529627.1 ABC transporter permease [Yinghuangia soli]
MSADTGTFRVAGTPGRDPDGTTTPHPRRSPAPRAPGTSMPPRLLGELRAEWEKLRTLHSTWWLLATMVVLTVAVGAASAGAVDTSACRTPESCNEDVVKLSLTGVWPGQVAVAVLAVLAVTSEYGTGTIRTTLTAMPSRTRVLAAKALVVSALTAAAGAVAVLGSLIAGRFLVAAGGFTPAHGYERISLLDGPTARAAFGTVIFLILIALLALGLAWAFRDTASALTIVLVLLYAFPILVSAIGDEKWADRLTKAAPASAGMSIQATRNLDQLPIGPWPGLAILTAWSATSLALGTLTLTKRDA